MLKSYDCFFFAFSLQISVSTHWKTNNVSTTYWNTSLDGSSVQQFRLILHCGLFTGIHIHTLRWKEKNHRILTHITSWVNCSTFLIVFSLYSVDRYPHPNTAKTKTTTYCHISVDGLNAEQLQMFLDCVAFTGICGHTVIDRLRHHHILTVLAWCSWCWTIWCFCFFNYFKMCQFLHTNTKSNCYVWTYSYCCREKYNLL